MMKTRWIALLVALLMAMPVVSMAQAPVQQQTQAEQDFAALWEALLSTEDPAEQVEILLQAADAAPDDVNMLISCAQFLYMLDASGEYTARCEQMLRRALRLAKGSEQRVMAQQALAEFLMNTRREEEAAEMLRDALAKSPDNPHLLYTLSLVLYNSGQEAEGIAMLEALLEDAPQMLEARVLRADIWRLDCEWDKAMQAYRQIETEWPNYLDGLYGQYQTAIASGQFDQGVRLLDKLISYGAGDALFLDRARVRLWNQFQPELAIEEADALLRMEPAWTDAATVKIGALLMLERYDEAHAVAEDVAITEPNFADLLHGIVLINEGKWREAGEVLEDIATRGVGGPLSWRNLSVVRLDGYDDIAGAEEALGHAFAETEGAGMLDLFTQLGFLRFRQGNMLEAARAFAAADRVSVDDPTGLYYLCGIHVDAGMEAELREVVAEMERRYPGWYETMLARVMLEDTLGNAQEAMDAYHAMVEKFPFAGETQQRLKALLLATLGDENGAQILKAYLDEQGDDATVQDWDAYAFALVLLGDTEGAEAALQETEARLNADTEYAGLVRGEQISILTTRAEIALEKGDMDACLDLFSQAVELGWASLRSLALNPRYAEMVATDAYAALESKLAPLPEDWDYAAEPSLPQAVSP